ncbi:CRISPR-associated protein Csn2-St [Anaerofustis sp. HA2171]|uniref:CRISPR-associated protein Csn2-St n=1 Tax=Anaerofustis butyriciformans TaxID=3108533 RepID=UPI002E37BFEE|nr:CRISPR-associated protein Csn2-St [Anaerofustis sp. HA2171]
MKVQIYNREKEYIINLAQITQLCGVNFYIKDFIINSIYKYFSNGKYMEYEKNMEENIKINDEKLGRNYFDIIKIKGKEDLINILKITKTGLINKYINDKIQNINFQRQLNIIDNALEEIYIKLNQNEFKNINFTYKREDLFNLIQHSTIKDIHERDLEGLKNIDLLKDFLILIKEIQQISPSKQMIIIENIEHMICRDEYEDFYEQIKELTYDFDLWFIIPICIENYVCLDKEYINGINIINDIIYSLTNMETIKYFIESNYPYFKNWEDKELITILKLIINKIGKEEIYNIKSDVILKIFNDNLFIHSKHLETLNTLENNFLLS